MSSRRFLIAVVIAAIGGAYYYCNTQVNPVTGEKQHVVLSPQDEVALGLQAAPQMAREFGGLHPDREAREYVRRVGQKVVAGSGAKNAPYPFDFHLLADTRTVNALALPGGQIFLTAELFTRLESEAQLAGVLGHEVGHVVHRHSAEHLAKQQFTQILVGAAAVAGSDDTSGGQQAAAIVALVGDVVNLRFSRNDELEADHAGVAYLAEARFDPRALAGVMEVLKKASGGAPGQPEFLSTHPDPGNRSARIQAEIARLYPDGVPSNLGEGDAHAFAAIRGRVAGGAGETPQGHGGGHHPDSQEN
ncbi:MAG: M48 family metalloprotease [Thermoanaerobaculia bacterium]